MSFIRQVSEDEANGQLERIYQAAIKRAGGVAHIIQVMSLDSDVCQASMQFYMSMMKRNNALDPSTREMLATVVSNVNDCYY